MQWRNGRDIQGGQISESPHGRSVYYMFICIHINIFNVSLTAWTVSSAAHLTLWGQAQSTERDGHSKGGKLRAIGY